MPLSFLPVLFIVVIFISSATATDEQYEYPTNTNYSSTSGQDELRCGRIILGQASSVQAIYSNWKELKGSFALASSGVQLASWYQSAFSLEYETVYFRTPSLYAVRAAVVTTDALEYLHDWTTSYNTSDGVLVELTDCEGELLFVAHFKTSGINIYSLSGGLLATTIVDPVVERFQFVDPSYNLLAIAESPGIEANYSRDSLDSSAYAGGVLPYEVKFELGGYTDASGLLDEEFRYVIASVVALHAIRSSTYETTMYMSVLGYVCFIAILAILTIALVSYLCIAFHQIVYGPAWSDRGPLEDGYSKKKLLNANLGDGYGLYLAGRTVKDTSV